MNSKRPLSRTTSKPQDYFGAVGFFIFSVFEISQTTGTVVASSYSGNPTTLDIRPFFFGIRFCVWCAIIRRDPLSKLRTKEVRHVAWHTPWIEPTGELLVRLLDCSSRSIQVRQNPSLLQEWRTAKRRSRGWRETDIKTKQKSLASCLWKVYEDPWVDILMIECTLASVERHDDFLQSRLWWWHGG